MDNLNTLAVFVRVAESRSFTAAARRLGISASGVSKSLARLEEDLGVRLINRTTRKVSLTEDGVVFFDRCRQILADLDEAETTLTQARIEPRGKLRVQMPIGLGGRVVVPALAGFMARHPQLTIDVELSDRVPDLAEEGLDAAIRIGELGDVRLIARNLCPIHFVTCAAPDYLRRHGEPKTPDDLEDHRCLAYVYPQTGRYRDWQFAKDGKRFSKVVSGSINVNNAESLLELAVAGAGIATMGTFIAADAIASGKLSIILADYVAPGPLASVVYLPSRHLSPRVRTFVEFLADCIPPEPAWDQLLARYRDSAGSGTGARAGARG